MPNNFQPEIHLNLNVRGLPVSATLHINELSHRLIKEGRRIYKLGLGQSPFPVPNSVVEELKSFAHVKDYLPTLGLPTLRQEIAGYYKREFHVDISSENVFIGPGSKELIFQTLLMLEGPIILLAPSWVSYKPQIEIKKGEFKILQTAK